MPLLGWVAANWLIGGQAPQPMGNDNFTAAPSGTFATADGYINIAANQQEQWESVADVLGVPELKADARFSERDTRKRHRAALTALLEEKLRTRTTAEWVPLLTRAGVPAGGIPTLQEALASAQIAHRGSLQTVYTPGIGDLKLFSVTAKFERTPGSVDTPPPRLGADTDAVLLEAGYSVDEVSALREAGAIGAAVAATL
jgi:crotonobetainyl-CoA:carnitine CoA-transferase CaiB-like acyl-CoA transferase